MSWTGSSEDTKSLAQGDSKDSHGPSVAVIRSAACHTRFAPEREVRLDDKVFVGGPFAPMRSRPDPGERPIKIEAQRDAKDVAQADKRQPAGQIVLQQVQGVEALTQLARLGVA